MRSRDEGPPGFSIEFHVVLHDRSAPANTLNRLLHTASDYGLADKVGVLLADSRVDPCSDGSMALRRASVNGHANVVSLLSADSRANPRDKNSKALVNASYYRHPNVARLLLADGPVDGAAGRRRWWAARVCVGYTAWFACAS